MVVDMGDETVEQFDAAEVVTDLPAVNTDALAELGAGDPAGSSDDTPQAPGSDGRIDAAGFRFVSGRHPVECRDDGRFYHATTGVEVLDATGRAFDPEVHDFDRSVEPRRPILTRAGLVRRRGASPGQFPRDTPFASPEPAKEPVVVLPQRDPEPGPVSVDTPAPAIAADPTPAGGELVGRIGSDANDAAADAFAAVLVASLSGAAIAIAGDWAEQSQPESDSQRAAWAAYLKTLDMTAPPAWSIPLLATLPWAARVARDERSPWNKRRRPKPPPTAQPDAQPVEAAPPQAPLDPPSVLPADFDRSSLDS